jgi:EAL domain-containing protein (putative c-di-GMP-specific phosphodiesterase class I)
MGLSGGPDRGLDVPQVDLLWKPFRNGALARRALDAIQLERPVVQAPVAVVRPASPVEPVKSSGSHILLVEDDEIFRTIVEVYLEGYGFTFSYATSGAQALELARQHPPHLALVDVNLSDMDGIELIPLLRREDALLPVLVISGDRTPETLLRAIRVRSTGYHTKPLERHQFVEDVVRVLQDAQVARLQRQLLISKAGLSLQFVDLATTTRDFEEALRGLFMVYQPILRTHDRSIYAYEALVRSNSTVLKGPMQLLAAAEALGRIEELGKEIRRSIARTLQQNPDCYQPIFVNLHPTELGLELMAEEEPLRPYASRIVLEVTERAQLEADNTLQNVLKVLRDAGYRIALDDLGEGYAGLSWLVKLTPDIAKLDMSLVRDLHQSRLKRELIGSLVAVCKRARTLVVAEGVETLEEAQVLTDLGCDLLQGYYFAKPSLPFLKVLKIGG